jgi:hypothetical protein
MEKSVVEGMKLPDSLSLESRILKCDILIYITNTGHVQLLLRASSSLHARHHIPKHLHTDTLPRDSTGSGELDICV